MLGTCAGLIMLDREHLGLADYTAKRNAFGRQVRSFEADLAIPGVDGGPVRAVFIRAPWMTTRHALEVLAEVDGNVVAARQENMLVISSTRRSRARTGSTRSSSTASGRRLSGDAPTRRGCRNL